MENYKWKTFIEKALTEIETQTTHEKNIQNNIAISLLYVQAELPST